MKRDLDLVRKILLVFEGRDSVSKLGHDQLAEEVSCEDARLVAYHIRLMAQAGLLACELQKSSTSDRIINAIPFELTWEGHEFLALSREESIWNQVKTRVGGGVMNMTFEIAKMLLTEEIKRRLGLKTS